MFRHGLALRGIDQTAIIEQNETEVAGLLDYVWCPMDASGIVAAEDGKHEADVFPDVLETAKNMDWN